MCLCLFVLCSVSVVCCVLCADWGVGRLFDVRCLLLVARGSLFVVRCLCVRCLLLVAYCLMFVAWCALLGFACWLLVVV